MALEFPMIDPVLLSIGPVAIRWYALSYLVGFLLGWRYCMRLTRQYPEGGRPNRDDIDDFLTWAVIGVVIGGRLGFVLFYQLDFFMNNPHEIYQVWKGGMSFHGGLIGVVLAALMFSARKEISVFRLADIICAGAPIGLFFGRLANFVNAELYGRVTTSPLGMIFPNSDGQPRHPSQLYEAGLEGLLLFIILFFMIFKTKALEKPGLIAGMFFALYGIFRAFVENFREPDENIGFFADFLTMGQILCLPMILFGVLLIIRAEKTKNLEN